MDEGKGFPTSKDTLPSARVQHAQRGYTSMKKTETGCFKVWIKDAYG
jgi:hypothetical protein